MLSRVDATQNGYLKIGIVPRDYKLIIYAITIAGTT